MNKVLFDVFILILLVILGLFVGVSAHFVSVQAFAVSNPSGIVHFTSLVFMPYTLLYTFKLIGFKFSKRGIVIHNLWLDFFIVVAIIFSGILISRSAEYAGTELCNINTEIASSVRYLLANSICVGGSLIYLLNKKGNGTR